MKLGVLGGAFDPVHNDHVKLAVAAVSQMKLDGVIVLPSYRSPHKDYPLTDYAHRLQMLRLALPYPFVTIDELEKETPLGRHYSYLMIPKLKEKYRGDDLVFLIGGDSLVKFDSWKNPEAIAREIPLWAVNRKGVVGIEAAAENLRRNYGAEVRLFHVEELAGDSSREIRAKIALGMQTEALPPAVAAYVEREGLYGEFRPIVEKLRAAVTPRLFAHMARTALYAVRLSVAAGVEYPSAFLGGLLHDCAKQAVNPADYPDTAPAVAHQYAGAIVAERDYGITDPDILQAICYHTTGRGEMSQLEKLVYAADKLEAHRAYPEVETLRAAIERDFEYGFRQTVKHNFEYALAMGYQVDSFARACYSSYAKKEETV